MQKVQYCKLPMTSFEVVELHHSLDTNQIKTPDSITISPPLHTTGQDGRLKLSNFSHVNIPTLLTLETEML
eukprot:scaffold567_cov230-Alexandrium_tamarense.AAC.22